MVPMIDYALLGRAVEEYQKRGYIYKEVPWLVPEAAIRATLPPQFPAYVAGPRFDHRDHEGNWIGATDAFEEAHYLVGSAEQSFLAMNLPPGAYLGVTPCFRHEPVKDIFYQTGFMKAELFVNRDDATVDRVLHDAREVVAVLSGQDPDIVATDIGFDLELAGVEIGSYGERITDQHGRWVYGTGLALPRFSVAKGLASVLQH